MDESTDGPSTIEKAKGAHMTNFEKPREGTAGTPGRPVGYDPAPNPASSPTPTGAPGTAPDAATGPAAAGPPSDYGTGDQQGQTETERPAPVGFDDRGRVKRGRVSTVWVTLIAAAVFLILLIIFIAQNQDEASIHYLGFSGHLATGLVVLIAAIVGVILIAIPGTIRIFQLRKSLKHNTPKDERVADR